MSDIVARLRDAEVSYSGSSINNGCAGCGVDASTCAEAADRIEALEAENVKLREALDDIAGGKIWPAHIQRRKAIAALQESGNADTTTTAQDRA